MKELSLLEPTRLGPLPLRNRLVMAPMTRCRNTAANVPTALMVEYYRQRAAAGQMYTDYPAAT